MVLGETAPSERLTARALEIETGGVHEHQIKRAEEVAPPREQILLQDVLQAARREGRGAFLLVLGHFLAEPGHRAIEMMEIEIIDALDLIIVPPAVRRAVRAAGKQAMQNGQEQRALQREIMLARAGQRPMPLRQPVSSHKRSNTRAAPIRRAGLVVASPSATAPTTMALSAKRAPDRNSRSIARSGADLPGDRAWR